MTAVSLFGTEEAWHAAQELADVIGEAMGATPRYSGEIEDKFLLTWKTVINAMRPDTAPVRLER